MAAKIKRKMTSSRRSKIAQEVSTATKAELDTLAMDEAIHLLRTTRATFYRWLRSGQIKGMKVGRKWRFSRSEMVAFMKGEDPKIELRVDVAPLLCELAAKLPASLNLGDTKTPSIADVAERMLMLGAHLKASEIHVGSHSPSHGESPKCLFRYRINGCLEIMAATDIRVLAPLAEYWKLQSGCNRSEKTPTFEGHYQAKLNNQDVLCRLTFLPTTRGEAFSIHIFQQIEQTQYANIERFIPNVRVRETAMKAVSENWGLTIIAGVTGSGKTSTLYSLMAAVSGKEKEIVAIDDEASVPIPWVTQLNVGDARGPTVNEALRMAARFRPDTLVVNEPRDSEAIRFCLGAAKNGLQVFSAVHAADAVGALQQQVALSGDAFLVSEGLRRVLAQRLLRKICPHCSSPHSPAEFHLALFDKLAKEYGFEANSSRYFRGKGCEKCSGSGYIGRTVVQEILTITPRIALDVQTKSPRHQLLETAMEEGMVPMVREAAVLVENGETSLEELLSAFLPSSLSQE